MQKITPFLWFDAQAEEAVAFYLSVFKDGKIQTTTRYPENGPPTGRDGDDVTWRGESGQSRALVARLASEEAEQMPRSVSHVENANAVRSDTVEDEVLGELEGQHAHSF